MAVMDKSKNNLNAPVQAFPNSLPLMGKLDGQSIIQAVVMSELLGKPKAKRRKRGHFRDEGTHCR